MRILCLLALSVALAGLATLAPRVAEPATSATPTALIDLGAIFSGDENEPDENESTEDSPAQQRPTDHARSISPAGVLLSAAVGAVAALFVASRLRRLRARLRRWGSGHAAFRSLDRARARSDRPE
jgi:hypothetical protein